MYKLVNFIFVSLLLLQAPSAVHAQSKASDFFRNLSKEKNLLEALYNKNRAKPKKDAKLKPITLSGEAGLLSTSGNTNISITKLALESNHEMTNWSNRYEAQLLQRKNIIGKDENESQVKTARFGVSAQFDYKLVEPNNRLFAYFEYDDNEFNLLRDQSTFVTGWSQVAWKENNSEFRYSIGPGYSRFKQKRNAVKISEMIVKGTVYYNFKFGTNSRFRTTLSTELGEEIMKAQSKSSVTATVFGKLAMKFSVNLVFNDNVPETKALLSTQTSLSLVYQFL